MSVLTPKDRTALTVLPPVAPAARPRALACEGTSASGNVRGEGSTAGRPTAGNSGHECVTLPGTGLDIAAKTVSKSVEDIAATLEDQAA